VSLCDIIVYGLSGCERIEYELYIKAQNLIESFPEREVECSELTIL
jgi:hypothetical protein